MNVLVAMTDSLATRLTLAFSIACGSTVSGLPAREGISWSPHPGVVRSRPAEETNESAEPENVFVTIRKELEELTAELASAQRDLRSATSDNEEIAKLEARHQRLLQRQSRLIEKFAQAPCKSTVDYLASLYGPKENLLVLMRVTETLGRIGTLEAVRTITVTASAAFARNPFAAQSIVNGLRNPLTPKAEEWFLKKGRLTKTLRNEPAVWRPILRAISGFKSQARIRVLIDELRKSKSPETQVTILEAFGESKNPKVAKAAISLLRSKHAEVQVAALSCLFHQDADRYRKQFVRGLRREHWQVRLLSLRVLAQLEDRDLVRHADRLLDDKEVKVQLTAIRTLVRCGRKDVVPPLIRKMAKSQGRVLDDVTDALTRLSGKDFGPAPAQWESWWAQFRDRPDVLRNLSAQEISRLVREQKRVGSLAFPVNYYHGLRVLSDNVVFLIDTSQSMSDRFIPVEEREAKAKERRSRRKPAGAGKLDEKPGDDRGNGEGEEAEGKQRKGNETGNKKSRRRTRMQVAKEELLQVIERLEDGKKFDIISFDSVVKDFIQLTPGNRPGQLARMDPAVRQNARAFVQKTASGGLTHMLPALEAAFSYPEVDTIFLLSDGAPTPESGGMVDILKYLRRDNRLRNVKINTIGFHLNPTEKQFLTQLAEENFGVFMDR